MLPVHSQAGFGLPLVLAGAAAALLIATGAGVLLFRPWQGSGPATHPVEAKVNPKDGLRYVWIPPGTFRMGCSPWDFQCRPGEKPRRRVEIGRGYWIGATEVTQAAWHRVMGANPSSFKGDDRPVDSVTWEEAGRYCAAIGGRLPTEAEWEYAARGGSTTRRYGELDRVAWNGWNSRYATHPVGQKQGNAWGLYDTLGNVWEWTADWREPALYERSPARDSTGATIGTERILRGGSCYNNARTVRVSYRLRFEGGTRYGVVGFRCIGR